MEIQKLPLRQLYHNFFFAFSFFFSYIILMILFFLHVSCASYSDKEIEEKSYVETILEDYNKKDIVEFIDNIITEDIVSSFVLIEKLYSNSVINTQQKETLYTNSVKKLTQNFETAIQKKQYSEGLLHYKNLRYLGEHEDIENDTIITLYYHLLLDAGEKKQYPYFNTIADTVYALYPEVLYRSDVLDYLFHSLSIFPDISAQSLFCGDKRILDYFDNIKQSQEEKSSDTQKAMVISNTNNPCTKDNTPNSVDQLVQSTFLINVDKGVTITEEGPKFLVELGSAFFISYEGHALTNYHVIKSEVDPTYEGKSDLSVKLQQNETKSRVAKVLSYDALLDIALIKVPYKPKYVIPISLEQVNQGDSVLVIGSPLGLTNTVSSGIISAKDRRRLLDVGGVLQVDASVNPGNSGGPLVNKNNQLVGVVYSKLQNFENLNFVIPSTMVDTVIPEMFRTEKIIHSWMGIGIVKIDEGLQVLYIAPNSPAEKSDIEIGDIIIEINGISIHKINKIQELFLDMPQNMLQNLKIKRNNNTLLVNTYTAEREKNPFSVFILNSAMYKVFPILIGASIEVTKYGSNPSYRIQEVYEDSYANFLGLNKGDIITVLHVQEQKKEKVVVLILNILQKERGFLTEGVQVVLPLSTHNFI